MSERPSEESEAAAGAAPGRRHWRPYPFEIAAWASLVIAVLFLRAHGLKSIDWTAIEYTVPPLFRPTVQVFLAGPLLYGVYWLLRRRPLKEYLRRIATPAWLLLWLRLWLTCFVFTYAYFWLKVSVPLINYRLWDHELWALDRAMHLGVSPSILLTELFQGTALVAPLEVWYGWWLPTMMFGLGFFCAAPDAGTRRRFMLSTVLIWTLGPWIYMAAPALGPIYVYGDTWGEIAPQLPRAQSTQAMLGQNYQIVLAGRRARDAGIQGSLK
ncbi:MAG: phosphatase PAP2 family protein, partial [Thermoanaerobaculia bacterium]